MLKIGDVRSATMMSRRLSSHNWVFTIFGLIGLNWPLLLLPTVGLQSEKIQETILVVPVFMTVLLTTIAYGYSRRIRIGSAMPVLLAGILSLLMIVVVAYVVRGDAYERAINNGTLSLSDAVGAEMNVFSINDATIDSNSAIWREEVSYTLFPTLGNKDRLCATPLLVREPNRITTPPVWAVFSIKSISSHSASCEAHLASRAAGPIVLKRIPGGINLKSGKFAGNENHFPTDRSHVLHAFKVMERPKLSAAWRWVILTVVVVALNAALFHIVRVESAPVGDASLD